MEGWEYWLWPPVSATSVLAFGRLNKMRSEPLTLKMAKIQLLITSGYKAVGDTRGQAEHSRWHCTCHGNNSKMLNQINRGMWDGHRDVVLPSLLYVVWGSGVEYPNDRDVQILISASFHSCAGGLRCLLDACVFYLFQSPALWLWNFKHI